MPKCTHLFCYEWTLVVLHAAKSMLLFVLFYYVFIWDEKAPISISLPSRYRWIFSIFLQGVLEILWCMFFVFSLSSNGHLWRVFWCYIPLLYRRRFMYPSRFANEHFLKCIRCFRGSFTIAVLDAFEFSASTRWFYHWCVLPFEWTLVIYIVFSCRSVLLFRCSKSLLFCNGLLQRVPFFFSSLPFQFDFPVSLLLRFVIVFVVMPIEKKHFRCCSMLLSILDCSKSTRLY